MQAESGCRAAWEWTREGPHCVDVLRTVESMKRPATVKRTAQTGINDANPPVRLLLAVIQSYDAGRWFPSAGTIPP